MFMDSENVKGRKDQVLVEDSDLEVPDTDMEELAAKRDAAQRKRELSSSFLAAESGTLADMFRKKADKYKVKANRFRMRVGELKRRIAELEEELKVANCEINSQKEKTPPPPQSRMLRWNEHRGGRCSSQKYGWWRCWDQRSGGDAQPPKVTSLDQDRFPTPQILAEPESQGESPEGNQATKPQTDARHQTQVEIPHHSKRTVFTKTPDGERSFAEVVGSGPPCPGGPKQVKNTAPSRNSGSTGRHPVTPGTAVKKTWPYIREALVVGPLGNTPSSKLPFRSFMWNLLETKGLGKPAYARCTLAGGLVMFFPDLQSLDALEEALGRDDLREQISVRRSCGNSRKPQIKICDMEDIDSEVERNRILREIEAERKLPEGTLRRASVDLAENSQTTLPNGSSGSNAKFSVTQVHISNSVAAAAITAGSEVLTVISAYFSPALSLRVGLEELGTLLDGLDMSRVIIGGDFNAHHPNWGPVRNTHRALDRGVSVLSFATSRALLIWNDPNSSPTFRRGDWESWIDLTMSSSEIAAPQTWKVAENPLSDHNLILFQTGEQALPMTHKYNINPHRLKKAARFFFNNYDNVSGMIERAPDKAAVDSAVEYLTEKLKETSAMKLKVTPKGRAPVHWWSPQLASFRNRCKALRRRVVRAGSAAEKEQRHIIFKRERAQYRRALLAAKRESWRGYCKNAEKVRP
ncbi:hypothetical protein JTE90_004048 [Oedothorax gibbosus]|uniref:Endonuclease/exonuclease/phosphatase domain-containing protein n=1 Tax=Oedothorax gibbosus TaxID=931172 RepID=A0AAV6U4K8_9ARAC|nr:hypothetical protein JTE90_004048 [Oedothorax gibbosus]